MGVPVVRSGNRPARTTRHAHISMPGCPADGPIHIMISRLVCRTQAADLDAVRPVSLRPIVGHTREGRLWNEYVARYHYLGYTTMVGALMRYAAHARDGTPLAMLGFSTAASRLAPASSAGRRNCARGTCRWPSTTRAS